MSALVTGRRKARCASDGQDAAGAGLFLGGRLRLTDEDPGAAGRVAAPGDLKRTTDDHPAHFRRATGNFETLLPGAVEIEIHRHRSSLHPAARALPTGRRAPGPGGASISGLRSLEAR